MKPATELSNEELAHWLAVNVMEWSKIVETFTQPAPRYIGPGVSISADDWKPCTDWNDTMKVVEAFPRLHVEEKYALEVSFEGAVAWARVEKDQEFCASTPLNTPFEELPRAICEAIYEAIGGADA